MFDIGFGEMLMLGIIGLVVLGPDRLPRFAAQAARFLRQFREQVTDARTSLIDAAAIDPETLRDLRDLDPRRVINGAMDDVTGTKAARPTTERKATLDPDTT